jgi:hypothetical protein
MNDHPTDEQIVTSALARCGGNARALARVLDVKPMRVYKWIERRRLAVPWRLYLATVLADPAWPPRDKLAHSRRSGHQEAL